MSFPGELKIRAAAPFHIRPRFPAESQTTRRLFLHIIALFLTAALLGWIYLKLAALGLDYEWQWNRVWRQLGKWTKDGFQAGPLLEGIFLTIGIAALGLVFSTFLGFFIAILKLSPWPLCSRAAGIYINIWRGTPLLLQLFFIYFLITPIFNLSPFWAAILSLSLFEGAYYAEIFRAGISSVARQQWEASLSLGFNLVQTLFWVVMPQAIRNALPALTNQAVAVLKDTSLVSAIAVADLTMRAQAIVAETFLAFEVWLFAAFIYLLLALGAALPGLLLEKFSSWH